MTKDELTEADLDLIARRRVNDRMAKSKCPTWDLYKTGAIKKYYEEEKELLRAEIRLERAKAVNRENKAGEKADLLAVSDPERAGATGETAKGERGREMKGAGMTVKVYGKVRQSLGFYQDPEHTSLLRLLLDSAQTYIYCVIGCDSERGKMLGESPVEVTEASDGNGDILLFADGTQCGTGGEIVPWTKSDMEVAVALRQLNDISPGAGEPTKAPAKIGAGDPDMLTIRQAAEYVGKSERTIREWIHSKDQKGGDMLPGVVRVGKAGRMVRIPRESLKGWR